MARRVRLIHWNAAEGRSRAATLREAGYRVSFEVPSDPAKWKKIRSDRPDAFVIDLTRLPSHGREAGLFLRQTKAARTVPQVFVGGDADKVARIRTLLPDATYSSWRGIRGALARTLAKPQARPLDAVSAMAGYSGTPLPKKLGIKAGSVVALVAAPREFAKTLGTLPDGAKLQRMSLATATGSPGKPRRHHLAIWFTRKRAELEQQVRRMAGMAAHGPMWIAWPKQTSSLARDVTQNDVRRLGLATGLVDYKICAIDEDWSGLCFARRKKPAKQAAR